MESRDIRLIRHLRSNSREKLSVLSKKTGIPISTVFEMLRKMEKLKIVQHKSLVSFEKVGFPVRLFVALKTDLNSRESLISYLSRIPQVNSLHLVNSGFDLHFEAVFKDQKEAQDFFDDMESKNRIERKITFNVIRTVHVERFLSAKDHPGEVS